MNRQLSEATDPLDFSSLIADIQVSIANLIADSGVVITSGFSMA